MSDWLKSIIDDDTYEVIIIRKKRTRDGKMKHQQNALSLPMVGNYETPVEEDQPVKKKRKKEKKTKTTRPRKEVPPEERCKAKKTNGNQCKQRKKSERYCTHHQKMVVQDPSLEEKWNSTAEPESDDDDETSKSVDDITPSSPSRTTDQEQLQKKLELAKKKLVEFIENHPDSSNPITQKKIDRGVAHYNKIIKNLESKLNNNTPNTTTTTTANTKKKDLNKFIEDDEYSSEDV